MVTISPRFLNANATICVAGDLEDLRELADRDELVDANGLLLALGLGGARRLELLARCRDAGRSPPRRDGAPRMVAIVLRDVRIHRFLIDRAALALLATTAAIGDAGAGTAAAAAAAPPPPPTTADGGRVSSRRAMPGPPPGAADAIGRGGNPAAARDRTRARRARRDRARTRTIGLSAGVRGELADGVGRARLGARRCVATSRRFCGGALRASRRLRPRLPLCGGAPASSARNRFDSRALRRRAASPRRRFLLRRALCGGLRGACGGDCGLLLGGGLHVGRLAAATDRLGADAAAGSGAGSGAAARRGDDARSARAQPASRRDALLALPARANARDLVVGEHAHMAANGNVHRPKKCDHFVGGDPEFVRQRH